MAISAPICHIWNPHQFLELNVVDQGDLKVASRVIQFNIYTDSKGGALFVNGGNFGFVEITLPDGKHVDGVPQFSLAPEPQPENPAGTFGKLEIFSPSTSIAPTGNQKVTFVVAPGGVPGPSSVHVLFTVKYHK
jgi:hypothetical protein